MRSLMKYDLTTGGDFFKGYHLYGWLKSVNVIIIGSPLGLKPFYYILWEIRILLKGFPNPSRIIHQCNNLGLLIFKLGISETEKHFKHIRLFNLRETIMMCHMYNWFDYYIFLEGFV